MKKYIETLLKNNRIIYNIYSLLMNAILNGLKMFIKVDEKIILFNSFGGKKYDDSPKAIFEYMLESQRYSDYKFYWGINEPQKFNIPEATVIKNNTAKYFLIALKAKYWITNSSIERGLKFKNKKTIYINTWHGTAIKMIGQDMQENNGAKLKVTEPDYYYAQSNYDIEIFSKAFMVPKEKILLSGLPRNDELCYITKTKIENIKKKLNIPLEKKVILYAPTFREYERDATGCILKPPVDLEKWHKELSKEFVVLFRAHYEVNKALEIKDDEFIKNMSDYENLNELMIISDILISDYSSIMVDYAILERPIYSYAYDYEKYKQKRGLYIDIDSELPNGYYKTEEELLKNIKNCDYKKQKEKTKAFKKKYIEVCGQASRYIDKIIRQ